MPGAAPYSGKLHPLVVSWWAMYDDQRAQLRAQLGDAEVPKLAINKHWLDGTWPLAKIQLVLCPGLSDSKPAGSCGNYTRPDGVTGEVLRYRDALPVEVFVATTGLRLQSKVLYGKVPTCGKYAGVPIGFAPPWSLTGDPVTPKQINDYAAAVSKQPVR